MKLSDFETLAQAQAYTLTNPQFFNNNTMNSVLTQIKLLGPLTAIASDFNHPFFDEAKAVLDSQEFNFRQDSPTGLMQIQMLDAMINAPVAVDMASGTVDLTAKLTQLKVTCLHIANPVTQPFANATQEQFDEAKAQGETLSTETTYDGESVPHFVTVNKSHIDVAIQFDEPVGFDCRVELIVSQKSGESTVFVDSDRKINVNVKAGTQALETTLTRKYARHIQVRGICSLTNTPFSLDVTGL